MSTFTYKPLTRGRLPHFGPAGRTLFVTSRLINSIPQQLIRDYKQKQQRLRRELIRIRRKVQDNHHPTMQDWLRRLEKFEQESFLKFDRLMDLAKDGPTWLKDDRVAAIVAEKLHEADASTIRLDAYCLMSNHIHLVFAPLLTRAALTETYDEAGHLQFESEYPGLAQIMKSIKGVSARACNQVLVRTGSFWERESFDHMIRPGRFIKTVRYVLNNPVKAGLVNSWEEWRWNYCRPAVIEGL